MNAVTRSHSKHVVEKNVLQDLPEVLDITPAELSEKQRNDKSLSKCFEMAERGEVCKAGLKKKMIVCGSKWLFQ